MKLPLAFSLTKFLCILMSFLHTAYSLGINDSAECIAHPDPHMTTFHGIGYDYQKGCDVVLVNTLNLSIQLRLAKNTITGPTFSSIERLAINFRNSAFPIDTLEIDSNGDHYLLSQPSITNPVFTMVGGYTFTKTYPPSLYQTTDIMIDLPPTGHYINVVDLSPNTEGGGLAIFIRGHGSMFYNARGMCGTWQLSSGLHDRNGVDLLPGMPYVNPSIPNILDGSAFGDNWQVEQIPNMPNEIPYISNTGLSALIGLHNIYPAACAARRRLLREENDEGRALQQSSGCDYCLRLNNLYQRANCEYDAMIIDCNWVQFQSFYLEDSIWYKSESCCFREEESDTGFVFAAASPNTEGSFVRKPCEYDSTCYQKKDCDSEDGCVVLKDCNGSSGACFIELDCFSECVYQVEAGGADLGFKLVSSNEGYIYSNCPHNGECRRKSPCSGSDCVKLIECSQGEPGCIKEFQCPDPCSPTSIPTSPPNLIPTSPPNPVPTSPPNPIPTPPPEGCCFREEESDTGFVFAEASPDTRSSFVRKPCEHDEQNCYTKLECETEDGCVVLKECDTSFDDKCYIERDCFSECVYHVRADEGFKLVSSSEGYIYSECPHNADCQRKIQCSGMDCLTLTECQDEDQCFKEFQCPDPCSPTSIPTSPPNLVPTSPPTPVPTSPPNPVPTSPPTPQLEGECDGCLWMHRLDDAVQSGDNTCINLWSVTLLSTEDGRCIENTAGQCVDRQPCLYELKLQWNVFDNCDGLCKIIIVDAYRPTGTPSTPLVFNLPITQGAGTKVFEAECLCDMRRRTFTLECESPTVDTHSLSYVLDYTCSECTLIDYPDVKSVEVKAFYP